MSGFEDHCWKDIVDEECLEIYKAYERPVFVGKRPALLLIDLYNNAFEGGPGPVLEANRRHPGAMGDAAWNAIAPTQALLAAARAAGLPVIYTTKHADANSVKSTNRQRVGAKADAWAIKDELAPQDGELVIGKERASGFFGTPLIAHLQKRDVGSLIICGESTSGCVRATTVEAYSYGYHCTLVEECCFDRSPLSHKVALFDLHHKYADVMHLDEVLEAIALAKAEAA